MMVQPLIKIGKVPHFCLLSRISALKINSKHLLPTHLSLLSLRSTSAKNVLLAVFFGLSSISATAGNWYDVERRNCDFESPVTTVLPTGVVRKATVAGGQVFSIPKVHLNVLLKTPGGAVFQRTALTTGQIASLRAELASLQTGPKAASVALSVVDKISDFSGVLGLAAGALFSFLTNQADAKIVSVDNLLSFVTIGGQSGIQMAFKAGPVGFKPLVMLNTAYEVQVGDEPKPRRWLFSACLLPVEVVLSEVETKDPGPNANNKKLIKQADGSWKMWDITDSKYNNALLLYTEQDETFAYFADGQDSTRTYRVGLYGGPMQLRSGGTSSWATLYKAVETK